MSNPKATKSKAIVSLYLLISTVLYFILYIYLDSISKKLPTLIIVLLIFAWLLVLVLILYYNYNKSREEKNISSSISIAYSSLSAALICIATMISIPLPNGIGYIHIGDSLIFLFSYFLPLPLIALAAGLGSAFADVFLGYSVYAIPTLIFKAGMAIIARYFIMNNSKTLNLILGLTISSILMQAGYYFVNTILFGEDISLLVLFFNLIQSIVSIPLAIMLIKAVNKVRDLNRIREYWVGL